MSTKKHIMDASTMLIEHGFHVFDEQRTHEQTAINQALILFNGGGLCGGRMLTGEAVTSRRNSIL
jgi:hypothetical protein